MLRVSGEDMKSTTIAVSLVLGLALASCGENTAQRARRLKLDAARIQNETTRAIVMEDMKFMVDLDEREQFFARLRKDMDRCKSITDELRTIDPGADLAGLEKNTKLILLKIRIDEERNENRRRISESRRDSPRSGEVRSLLPESIAEVERAIELIEEAGEDAGEAKKQLGILKKEKAEEDRNGGATRADRRSLSELIAGTERAIESFEKAGLDTSDARKFLEELKKQKAAEDSSDEAAGGMESEGKSGEVAPPESEQGPR